MEPTASGRPRRYCSTRCRQRAYRQRTRAATQDEDGLIALARHLRDNVDRLWMLAQGWNPPPDEPGPGTIPDLAADTAHVAAQLAELDQVHLPQQRNNDETDDETHAAASPDRGRNEACGRSG